MLVLHIQILKIVFSRKSLCLTLYPLQNIFYKSYDLHKYLSMIFKNTAYVKITYIFSKAMQ